MVTGMVLNLGPVLYKAIPYTLTLPISSGLLEASATLTSPD